MNPFSGADRLRRARQERKAMAADYLSNEAAPMSPERRRRLLGHPFEGAIVCGECGALVYQRNWHQEWHREIEGGAK